MILQVYILYKKGVGVVTDQASYAIFRYRLSQNELMRPNNFDVKVPNTNCYSFNCEGFSIFTSNYGNILGKCCQESTKGQPICDHRNIQLGK